MTTESAQMLSTVHHVLSSPQAPHVFKATHPQHRCAVWARSTVDNYCWLRDLALALAAQYTERYGRTHAVERLLRGPLADPPPALNLQGLTPFALAMPAEYQIPEDPILSYRLFYVGEKLRFARWRYVPRPWWISDTLDELDYRRSKHGV